MRIGSALPSALALLVWCSSAFAFDCMPGRYLGKSWSANPELHNKDVELLIAQRKDFCELKFKCPAAGAEEVWELAGKKIVQRELGADGKEKAKYGATLDVRGGAEGYYIDCAGGDPGKCDASVDSRSFWQLKNEKGNIVYTFWGVDPAKAGDPKEQPRRRIEYTFKPSP